LRGAPIIQDDEYIQTLMDLGLTFLQAKIYLTLAKLGKAEAKTISKASNVARPDVYRVMPTLEKLGLAEKIIATPTIYKATPLKEGYYFLLQKKTREHTELQQKTIDLIRNSHESNDKTTLQKEEQQFVLISSKTLLLKKCGIEDSMAQTSIDVVGDYEGVMGWFFKNCQNFERAIKRGVKIRIITEKHKSNESMQKISPIFKNNPLFEIRYITSPVPIKTVIYDGKKANMYVRTSHNNEITPSLWSNNHQFAKVMTAYFEKIWDKAQDSPRIPAIQKRRHKSAAKLGQTV
jgi:sugar-specific transcriptional regulator TrmB